MLRMKSAFLILFLSASAFAQGRKHETGFLDRAVTLEGTVYRYQVYVPNDWNAGKRWPVILFLHGAGERGDDGLIQTEVGIGTVIRRHKERVPAIVVLPQCAKDSWWPEPEMQAQALKALDQSIKEFNGDPQRVYLTGLSMGGYGTWALVASHPDKFAALAPICGGLRPPPSASANEPRPEPVGTGDPYAIMAQKVGKTPVWVFHGGADPVVPVSESQKMVEAIKAEGGNVKYNEYEGVGHNSWDKAYAEPEFFDWLFAQSLKPPAGSRRK